MEDAGGVALHIHVGAIEIVQRPLGGAHGQEESE